MSAAVTAFVLFIRICILFFLGEISNQNYCYEAQHQNENHIVVLLAAL